jgi:hypothetical protein
MAICLDGLQMKEAQRKVSKRFEMKADFMCKRLR